MQQEVCSRRCVLHDIGVVTIDVIKGIRLLLIL